MNFFTIENNFWFENLIAFFYLLVFWLLQKKHKPWFLIGLLIGLSSLIKPTALIVLLPLLVLYPNFSVFMGFILVCVVTLGYFAGQHALWSLWQNLFVFNSQLPSYVFKQYSWQDQRFLLLSGILFLIFVSWRYRFWTDPKNRHHLLALIFLFTGLMFIYPVYGRSHLTVLSVFVPIFLTFSWSKSNQWKKAFFWVYYIYLCLLSLKHWQFLRIERQPYQQSPIINVIMKKYSPLQNKPRFWVMGNQAELYYYFEQLPPTYFPIYFRQSTGRFFPDFEQRTIKNLKQEQIKVVIEPLPKDSNYVNLIYLQRFLKNNFKKQQFLNFNIYRFKTR